MSTIDLIILGILQEKSMNAYELARYIDEKQVYRLLKISQPAVYKNCKKLFQEDYLEGEKIREGENPEKVMFTVNEKGHAYFNELMIHFSSHVQPLYLDFNVFIWNIQKLPPKKALEMFTTLGGELKRLKNWIIQHEKEISDSAPFPVRQIVKQGRMMYVALDQWAEEAFEEFKQKKGK